jgi:hypothetical protein
MKRVGPGEDLVERQGRLRQSVAVPSVFRQQAGKRTASRKATEAFAQGQDDGFPRLAGRSAHRARPGRGPAPMSGAVLVGPDEDLVVGQARQVRAVPVSAVFREQAGQRAPPHQSAAVSEQGCVDRLPRLAEHTRHRAGSGRGPAPMSRVVFVGPDEDLVVTQRRQVRAVPVSALFREQAG